MLILAAASVGIVSMTVYSCDKEEIMPGDQEKRASLNENEEVDLVDFQIPNLYEICGEVVEKPILNAKGRSIGTAYLYNDRENAHFVLKAAHGYLLKDAYLDFQAEPSLFVVGRNGEPDLTTFRYRIEGERASNYRVFSVPKDELRGKIFVACKTHYRSSLIPTQPLVVDYNDKAGAWVEGEKYGNRLPGMIFKNEIHLCSEQNATRPNRQSTGGAGSTTVQTFEE